MVGIPPDTHFIGLISPLKNLTLSFLSLSQFTQNHCTTNPMSCSIMSDQVIVSIVEDGVIETFYGKPFLAFNF